MFNVLQVHARSPMLSGEVWQASIRLCGLVNIQGTISTAVMFEKSQLDGFDLDSLQDTAINLPTHVICESANTNQCFRHGTA